MKILLTSLLALASFVCLAPPLYGRVADRVGIKRFYLPWIGIILAIVWTWLAFPPTLRGFLFGGVLIAFGLMLLWLPKRPALRRLIEDMFFGRKPVFLSPALLGQASSFIAVGLVTIAPHFGRVIDSLVLLGVVAFFIWSGVRRERAETRSLTHQKQPDDLAV
ncbi:MAG: hypothetical protein N838_11915 [Thiohalocapsa sp. PB-PSB1]|jgi:MFS family permease|nr:MAG: hypothetical protein N838_11915 [Thiohalocapsa sp. PB-PSB1]